MAPEERSDLQTKAGRSSSARNTPSREAGGDHGGRWICQFLLLEQLPASIELAVYALEVPAHGSARCPSIPRFESREDGAMVMQSGRAQFRRLEVVFHSLPNSSAPLIPEVATHRDE